MASSVGEGEASNGWGAKKAVDHETVVLRGWEYQEGVAIRTAERWVTEAGRVGRSEERGRGEKERREGRATRNETLTHTLPPVFSTLWESCLFSRLIEEANFEHLTSGIRGKIGFVDLFMSLTTKSRLRYPIKQHFGSLDLQVSQWFI